MIGWHVVPGPDANLEGMSGVVIEMQDMGGGVERVETVMLAVQLVVGRRRVMRVNFGRNAYRTQPCYTLALLWERDPLDMAGMTGSGWRITRSLRLYWQVQPALCNGRTKVDL